MASTIGLGVIIGFVCGYLVASIQSYRKISNLRSMWNDFLFSQKRL